MFTVVLFCRRDIYRLNLELGQFLNSFESEGSEVNKVAINPCHQLVVVGTREGRVEAWDPRTRGRVGVLDCALSSVTPDTTPESVTNWFNLSSKTFVFCFQSLFIYNIHRQNGIKNINNIHLNVLWCMKDDRQTSRHKEVFFYCVESHSKQSNLQSCLEPISLL